MRRRKTQAAVTGAEIAAALMNKRPHFLYAKPATMTRSIIFPTPGELLCSRDQI